MGSGVAFSERLRGIDRVDHHARTRNSRGKPGTGGEDGVAELEQGVGAPLAAAVEPPAESGEPPGPARPEG